MIHKKLKRQKTKQKTM